MPHKGRKFDRLAHARREHAQTRLVASLLLSYKIIVRRWFVYATVAGATWELFKN